MNKTTKHYFTNLFKRKTKLLALYTAVCFFAYPFLEIASLFANRDASDLVEITKTSFYLALFVLGILSAVLPIFTFKFSHTKKHVDTYFSIPINRNHLFKSHFIAPILGACIPILINYLIGGLILVIFKGNVIVYFELFALLLLVFAMFVVNYCVNTFFVLNSNNVLDSSIIVGTIAILPLIFIGAIDAFISSQIVYTGMFDAGSIIDRCFRLLSPYLGFTEIAHGIDVLTYYSDLNVNFGYINWMYVVYYFVIGFVFYFLSKKVFKKKKGENAEQLTNAFVTYPLMINVGIISLVLMFNIIQMDLIGAILMIIVLFVIYVIAQAIANRSMAINKKMILKFVLLVVIVNGFNYVSRKTEFFGINRQVIDYTKYDEVQIHYYSYSEKYGEDIEEKEYSYTIVVDNINEEEMKIFDLIKQFQEIRSVMFRETGQTWFENVYGSLRIEYVVKDGVKEYIEKTVYYDVTAKEETQIMKIYMNLYEE